MGKNKKITAETLINTIEQEFEEKPPTICVVGVSGVGKSLTINSMFGTRLTVSATTRGTKRFYNRGFDFNSERLEGRSFKTTLRVIDAPGLGEDIDLDENYLARYKRHLGKCDVTIWVLAARNRALALDQQYMATLSDQLQNTVIAINQVDLIDPIDWNTNLNLPSKTQEARLQEIVEDRKSKLSKVIGKDLPAVGYSALHYYNLQKLFAACIEAAPPERRWMFHIIKSFSTLDWLNLARGISEEHKQILANRHIQSEESLDMNELSKVVGAR